MSIRIASLVVLALSLAGCVAYRAEPIAPERIVAAQAARAIDPQAVSLRVEAMAPGASAAPLAWDRLALFAAATLYNRDIAAARAVVATVAAEARASRTGPAPALTLSSEYAKDRSATSPWLFGGALDLPLDIGARRDARIAVGYRNALAARYALADAIWSVRMAMRRALAERLVADRQIAGLTALARLRARQLAAVERRVAAGAASRGDLERARADGVDVARRLADAEAARRGAMAALAAAIGVPEVAIDSLPFVWSGFEQPSPMRVMPVDTDARRAAILSRADVFAAINAYDRAEAELRGEVAKQFPMLSLQPGYTWERGLVKLPFSIGLALPPLDLNRRAIAAAEARRAEAGRRLEAVLAAAQAAVDAALVEATAARAALAEIRTVERPTAERLAQQAVRELAAGATDRASWAAAQAGAEEARLAELTALARVHAADAALEDALRRPIEGPELDIEQETRR